MAKLTPAQRVWRGRIETGLKIAAPFLDLLLAVGDRVSRVLTRPHHDDAALTTRRPIASLGPGPTGR